MSVWSSMRLTLQISPRPSCAELPDLCEGFWQQDSPCARVLRYALDDARDALFPAAAAPLLRMLTALTADSGTALFAAQYLRSLRGMAAVHEKGGEIVAPNGSEDTVVAAKAFALPGLPLVTVPQVGVLLSHAELARSGLTRQRRSAHASRKQPCDLVCRRKNEEREFWNQYRLDGHYGQSLSGLCMQGTKGRRLRLPPTLRPSDGRMDEESDEDSDARFLVVWQLQAPPEVGCRIVMYRAWAAAAELQQAQVWQLTPSPTD